MDIALVNRMAGITRGGGEVWDVEIATALLDRGHDVTFYVGQPLTGAVRETFPTDAVVPIPTPHLRELAYRAPRGIAGALADTDSVVFRSRTARALAGRDHDLVQVCSDPWFARMAIARETPTSIVMHGTPHSLWHDTLNPLSSSYRLFGAFDTVVAVGGAYDEIRTRTETPVTRVDPGVDTDAFTPADDRSDDDRSGESARVLFVGRFVPAKNLKLLIDGVADLRRSDTDVHLRLVGGGPLESALRRHARRAGIAHMTEFPGYRPHGRIADEYRAADVFALSSSSEAHPITIMEAMSCGVPVVAPDVGAISEIVDHGETGLVYEPGNRIALVEALRRLADDRTMRAKFGARARQRATASFDWDRRADALLRAYEQIL